MNIQFHGYDDAITTLIKSGLVMWRSCPYTPHAGITGEATQWPLSPNDKGDYCVRWPFGHIEMGYEPVVIPNPGRTGLRIFLKQPPPSIDWTHIVITGCSRALYTPQNPGCLFGEFAAVPWKEFVSFRNEMFDAYRYTFTMHRKDAWPSLLKVVPPTLPPSTYRMLMDPEQSDFSRHGKDVYYHIIE